VHFVARILPFTLTSENNSNYVGTHNEHITQMSLLVQFITHLNISVRCPESRLAVSDLLNNEHIDFEILHVLSHILKLKKKLNSVA
jgi:hypothetical protein